MRNYLDLIPIQSSIHKKQSRMTRICIYLSVFLVMTIFGMADMEIVSQKVQAIKSDGNWHAVFKNISGEQADLLAARPEVKTVGWYDVINYGLDGHWQVEGQEAVICGMNESLMQILPVGLTEGDFPAPGEDEVVCTTSIKDRLGVQLGDEMQIEAPDGRMLAFAVSGFSETTSMLTEKDAFGIFTDLDTFRTYFTKGRPTEKDNVLYVQFAPFCNIRRALSNIKEQFGFLDEQVGENAKLLGLMLQSSDPYLLQIYLVAAVLAVLVAVAGILMITGSLNSSVAQRTEFFGLMRCLGATPKQIMRFVRKEALGWCKTAIPAALLSGTAVIWGLCQLLRYLSPNLFEGMPLFGISWIGIGFGIILGISTVLLAAYTPAKKASKVTPLSAVSGNAGTTYGVKSSADTRWLPIEISLGCHHARGSLKNLLLMSGSFAFGILLFMSFTTLHDFMNHAFTPLRPWSPDLSVISPDNSCSLPEDLAERIAGQPSVRRVYGRKFAYDMDAGLKGQEIKIHLISYESHQLAWAKDYLFSGTVDKIPKGESVLAVLKDEGEIQTGEQITIETEAGEESLPVSGVLTTCPFDQDPGVFTVICSEGLFKRLTGKNGYTILDIQVKREITDQEVEVIRKIAGENVIFSDKRQGNAEVMGVYYAFLLFLYGFLTVILMISAFHIINSMSMSASARMGQYQSMYAIGMGQGQLIRMVAAEAFFYTLLGIFAGGAVGCWFHRLLYRFLVTSRWGDAWQVPAGPFLIAAVTVLLSSALSILGPGKRIRNLKAV